MASPIAGSWFLSQKWEEPKEFMNINDIATHPTQGMFSACKTYHYTLGGGALKRRKKAKPMHSKYQKMK